MKQIASVFCGLILAGSVQAVDVYYWTDADGRTNYSQTPPAGVDAELIDVETGRASAGSSAQDAERRAALDARLKAGREAREAERIARQEARESSKQTAQECAEMRRKQEQFVSRSRIYDSGADRYLTEPERQARITEIGEFLDQNCR
ncbi:MAG: DUF4124 domain-containing protein [Gammaproteobacteria bacterium]|nr:DUF4124 domain-containing protein [Gammaproteobacteria bacterium]